MRVQVGDGRLTHCQNWHTFGNFIWLAIETLFLGDSVAADALDDDDEDSTSQEKRFELKTPENPSTIKKGPYRVYARPPLPSSQKRNIMHSYVHLHEARDMRSCSDPAKRHKFPAPVFIVQVS